MVRRDETAQPPRSREVGEVSRCASPAGGERILLEHLHPRFAYLSTHLRGVAPRAVASIRGQIRDLELRCDTLAINADRGLAVLSWRGHLGVDHPVQRQAGAMA